MNPRAIEDSSDVTVVIHHLVGGAASRKKILDLKLVDMSPLFEGDPSPCWMVTALVIMCEKKSDRGFGLLGLMAKETC